MNKDLKSSPFSLNNFNLDNSSLSQNDLSINYDENIFSSHKEELVEIKEETKENISKKRLNDLDGNILSKVATFKEEERSPFLKKLEYAIKNKKVSLPNSFGEFLLFLFPSFDKSKVVRESLNKLKKINSIANELVSGKIPFGEGQERYKELSDNISLACSIQANLKKKIK